MMNPQVKYGEDVVSRISFHMENPDGLKRMSKDLVSGLNDLRQVATTGVACVIVGKALLEGCFTVEEAIESLS